MSSDSYRWAWQQTGIRPTDKLVLLSMAERVGEDMTCFPSIQRVSDDTLLDRKTVQKSWERLRAAGLIEDTGRRCGQTKQVIIWQLVGVEKREETTPKKEQFQKRERSQNSHQTTPKKEQFQKRERSQNSHQTIPKTDGKRSQKRDTESPRESPKESPSGGAQKSKLNKTDLINQYGVPADVAAEYLEVRRAKKAPLTQSAMDTLVREFFKAGLSVPDGIKLCAAKGWQGFMASWNWQESAAAVLGKHQAAVPPRPREFPE